MQANRLMGGFCGKKLITSKNFDISIIIKILKKLI
jgi:hypothetical protein